MEIDKNKVNTNYSILVASILFIIVHFLKVDEYYGYQIHLMLFQSLGTLSYDGYLILIINLILITSSIYYFLTKLQYIKLNIKIIFIYGFLLTCSLIFSTIFVVDITSGFSAEAPIVYVWYCSIFFAAITYNLKPPFGIKIKKSTKHLYKERTTNNKVGIRLNKKVLLVTIVIILTIFINSVFNITNRIISWTKNEKRVVTYESGQPKEKGMVYCNEDGNYIKTDLWRWWYENGSKMKEGNFIDGKKDGKWIEWYENGNKKEEGSFIDDKKDGKWIEWRYDGIIEREEEYKNGKRNGIEKNYYTDGKVFKEKSYKNDQLNGSYTKYCKNGQVEVTGQYKYGNEVGKWEEFYCSNGNLYKLQMYNTNGDKHGEYKKYNEKGDSYINLNYKNDKIIDGKSVYQDEILYKVENGRGVIAHVYYGDWGPEEDIQGRFYSCNDCKVQVIKSIRDGEITYPYQWETNGYVRKICFKYDKCELKRPGRW